jgi:hypothetical protein
MAHAYHNSNPQLVNSASAAELNAPLTTYSNHITQQNTPPLLTFTQPASLLPLQVTSNKYKYDFNFIICHSQTLLYPNDTLPFPTLITNSSLYISALIQISGSTIWILFSPILQFGSVVFKSALNQAISIRHRQTVMWSSSASRLRFFQPIDTKTLTLLLHYAMPGELGDTLKQCNVLRSNFLSDTRNRHIDDFQSSWRSHINRQISIVTEANDTQPYRVTSKFCRGLADVGCRSQIIRFSGTLKPISTCPRKFRPMPSLSLTCRWLYGTDSRKLEQLPVAWELMHRRALQPD